MKIVFFDASTIGDDITQSKLFEIFDGLGELYLYNSTKDSDMAERVRDADVLITNKCRITKTVLDAAQQLKLICVCATGYDNVDINECGRRGIALCNLRGYSTDSVAQVTVSMVLALVNRLNTYNQYVHDGTYAASGRPNQVLPVYHEICGMTWGIVGCGEIGSKVAQIARAFGARVVTYSREASADIKRVDIDELCRTADIITLHVPLTNDTRHMINERRISNMKRSVVLINAARGEVVDEAAVTKAIIEGRIGGLGVDVYSKEPMARNSPYVRLYGMNNVIFTPHMAWGAYEARVRALEMVRDNICSFMNGEHLNRIV